jgi:hypothetical protein
MESPHAANFHPFFEPSNFHRFFEPSESAARVGLSSLGTNGSGLGLGDSD